MNVQGNPNQFAHLMGGEWDVPKLSGGFKFADAGQLTYRPDAAGDDVVSDAVCRDTEGARIVRDSSNGVND
jgi:hypothetical protein